MDKLLDAIKGEVPESNFFVVPESEKVAQEDKLLNYAEEVKILRAYLDSAYDKIYQLECDQMCLRHDAEMFEKHNAKLIKAVNSARYAYAQLFIAKMTTNLGSEDVVAYMEHECPTHMEG